LIVFENRVALDGFRMQPGTFLANATANLDEKRKSSDYPA